MRTNLYTYLTYFQLLRKYKKYNIYLINIFKLFARFQLKTIIEPLSMPELHAVSVFKFN